MVFCYYFLWLDACIWHMFVDLQFRLPVSMKLCSRIALLTCPINSHVTYQWGEVLHVDPFHSLVGLKNQLLSHFVGIHTFSRSGT